MIARFLPMAAMAALMACAPPPANETVEAPPPVPDALPLSPMPTGATAGPNGLTILSAPSPEYGPVAHSLERDWTPRREATTKPPRGAGAEVQRWIDWLEPQGLLAGAGFAPPQLDLAMTAEDFDALLEKEGRTAPTYFDYSFVAPLRRPALADDAREGIRLWPASPARSGAGNQAAYHGRIVLDDGCFFTVDAAGKKQLAWFPAEAGLMRDEEGYLTLVDRRWGHMLGRIGEEFMWAGPNRLRDGVDDTSKLQRLCGNHPIHVLSLPEAMEKVYVTYPHLRTGASATNAPPAPPKPPGN
ncbi:hypothetical protein [Sphingomicrobium flavum]|uniref:hypothetical protein n=1 Tax=Sphingomicrobium flavum TaxID=1229164 RepID=UPI0021AE3024|nr:hypothetical protein [Sphingomicrobium flavum]